jgi:hypothetical protein
MRRALRRAGLVLLLAAAGLWPCRAGAGPLDELGIRVVESPGGAAAPRTAGAPRRPADALPDGRPGLGTGALAAAWLIDPTRRYGHGVLGDAVEAGGLLVVGRDGRRFRLTLPEDSVFEDLQPRLADLDGDGRDEIVVVRSYAAAGAALAVLGVVEGALRLLTETPPIGRPNRWLNPVGAGDFDGDGRTELAYVETPHIGGILRIWRLQGGRLVELGSLGGFSNHAIGARALGLSALLDLDGDGSVELLLPAAGRRALRLIGFAGGAFRELGRLDHRQPISGDFEVADRDGNGRADVAYGLADGTLVQLLR